VSVHFNSLASIPEPYYCHHCITDEILFSNLTNEEIQKLFNHVCNVKHITLTLAFDNSKDTPTEPDMCCECYGQSSSIRFIENKRERDLFPLHCNVRRLQKNLPNLLKSTPDIIAKIETRLNHTNIGCINIILKVMIFTIMTLINVLVALAYIQRALLLQTVGMT